MYGYVYLTTNLINNKKYIGQHCSTSFDEKYLGSGKRLVNAINKYGKENFSCVVLRECYSREELDNYERFFIEKYNAVCSDDFYNIALGGKMCQLSYQTDETKEKISKSNTGKKRTSEMNYKNSQLRIGAKWMNNGVEQKYVLSDDVPVMIELGWHFGMIPGRKSSPASEDRKLHISNALKGKHKSAEHIKNHSQSLKNRKAHWYTDGKNNLLICECDNIPENFYPGKVVSEESKLKNSLAHKGRTPWNKGKNLK